MILELSYSTDNEQNIDASVAKFNKNGGTIGRAPTNDLVLDCPEKQISRQHAKIYWLNDHFFIEDTSANGVYINTEINPLGTEACHIINDDDIIRIGNYTLNAKLKIESRENSHNTVAISSTEAITLAFENELVNVENTICSDINLLNDNSILPQEKSEQTLNAPRLNANTNNQIINQLGNFGDNFSTQPDRLVQKITPGIKTTKIKTFTQFSENELLGKELSLTGEIRQPTIDKALSDSIKQTASQKSINSTIATAPDNINLTATSTSTANIQALLSGMGIDNEVVIEHISDEHLRQLGQLIVSNISALLLNKQLLDKFNTDLSIDKSLLTKNQQAIAINKTTEDMLINALTDSSLSMSLLTQKITNLHKDILEDQRNLLRLVRDIITNLENDLNPFQIELDRVNNQNASSETSNNTNQSINTYKNKWQFMCDNWHSYYRKSIRSVRKSYEKQLLVVYSKRKFRNSKL